MKNKPPENIEWADVVGKTSTLELHWKDWNDLPKNGDRIYIILKLADGYFSTTGVYFDKTLPASGPFPESRWQTVRFDEGYPTAIVGGEHGEKLFAWSRAKLVGRKFYS
jgi:hypothetical protein